MGSGKTDPLLSVVIPVYNVESCFDRCMKSVMRQTYTNLEIILVDDGSTDRSGMMCDSYAAADGRIKVIHKENGGQASARKAGLREATGKYATCVDSDDWIEPEMYRELVSLAAGSDADIATSGCIRDYGAYSVVQNEKIEPGVYEKEKLVNGFLMKMISVEVFFRPNVIFSACNKIYRKELLEKWQGEVDDYINIGEDAALLYPCYLNAGKVVVSGKNYYHYCIRNGSVMGSRKEDEMMRYRVLFRQMEEQAGKHQKRVPNLMEQVKLHEYYLMLLQCTEKIVRYQNGILFPFGRMEEDDEIVIYGAGRFGCALKTLLELRYGFRIAAWVDQSGKAGTRRAECLDGMKYDRIIIAVLLDDIKKEIQKRLTDMGVAEEKILLVNFQLLKGADIGIE